MSLFVLKRNYEFNLPMTASIDLVNLKFTKLLNLFNFITGHNSDIIVFKRKLFNANDTGVVKREAFSVFREGEVRIYTENNKLKISWSVKLDNLYFLSFLIDIVLVLLTWHFFNPRVYNLVIIAIIVFLGSCFFGKTEIISKIVEINTTCLDE
jgi:hypothetical protein